MFLKALERHGIVSIKSVKGKNNIYHASILLNRRASSEPETVRIFNLLKVQLKKENKEFDPLTRKQEAI